MWEFNNILIYELVLFFAGMFMSVTGFGFGLISTTVLFLLFSPHEVVHALAMPFLAATTFACFRYRKHISVQRIFPYALLTLPGILLGTWLHLLVPAFALQFFLAGLLFYALFHERLPSSFSILVAVPFSASLAGFANGTIGTAGPPVIAWSMTKPWTQNHRKASTLSIFLIAGSFRTLLLCFEPTFIVPDQALFCALLLPSIFIGILVGEFVANRVDEQAISRIVNFGIVALAITLTLRGLHSLMTQ
jgi:uncharacterized protein